MLRLQHSTSQYIIINFAHASTLNMPPKKRGRYSGSRELKIFSDIKTLALWFIFGDIKGVAKPRGFREEGFKCPGGARKRHKRRSRNDRAFMTLILLDKVQGKGGMWGMEGTLILDEGARRDSPKKHDPYKHRKNLRASKV